MIQICKKDKEKIYDAIRSGTIDTADLSFPNLIDDIILTMKKQGILALLPSPWKINAAATAIFHLISS